MPLCFDSVSVSIELAHESFRTTTVALLSSVDHSSMCTFSGDSGFTR
jgi:hypothetical protein